MKPNTLTALAKILTYSGHKDTTVRDLLLASARLGDDEAILLVIKEAIKLRNLSYPRMVAIIYEQRFRPMVHRKHPAAVYLEGQKRESAGQDRQALKLYESIVAAKAESFDMIGGISGVDIWKAISILRAKNKDRTGAEAAIRVAALQYDDPAALCQLAKTFIKPHLAQYESFMLKAAASGEAKAAYELGLLYLKQSEGQIPFVDGIHSSEPNGSNASDHVQSPERGQRSSEDSAAMKRRLLEAQEWFNVAAASGIIGGKVYLAHILRNRGLVLWKRGLVLWARGYLEEGHRWLISAAERKDDHSQKPEAWDKVIKYFLTRWDESDFNPKSTDIEKMRKSGPNDAN